MDAARPRLGVLGGSFDPPHIAHLVIASEACARLQLEHVLFVPAAAPPHKDPEQGTAASMRLAMTALAVEDDLRFVESGLEIEHGIVYTRDLLTAVAARFPGRDLVFVMGSDSLLQFASWHDPLGILALADLAVVARPGDTAEDVRGAVARWGADRVHLLQAPGMAVSSTLIRERVATGLPVRYLVSQVVEEYIVEHGLYRRP